MLNSKMTDATRLTVLEGRKMKNAVTRCLALVMLLLMVVTMTAFATEKVGNTDAMRFVNDSVNVLSTEAKNTLVEVSQKMAEEYGMQIFISTFEDLSGVDVQAMEKEYLEEDALGVIILLGTDDNEVLIGFDNKMMEYVSGEEIESLIAEYAIPNFAKKEYGNGMIELQKWLVNYIMTDIYPKVGQPLLKEAESIDASSMKKSEDIGKVSLGTNPVVPEKSNSTTAVLIVSLIILVIASGVFLKMRVLIKNRLN